MKEFKMYRKIKEYQEKGFSVRKTAVHLGISRDTVKKYRDMSLDEYMALAQTIRKSSYLDTHRDVILGWLHEYPDMSSAQVYDWLLEHYQVNISERTVSRYVKELREEYGIKKTSHPRDYEASDEVPMGHQMQLDFGEKHMPLPDRKGSKKVYFLTAILAHSRYKWGYFQTKPFTSIDLTRALDKCFRFFGGTTKEIVVDQDSIITVNENYGDIIYTYEFEKYRQRHNLNIRVCRKADPESKGLVENTVKFVKKNFLPHRYFMEEDLLNQAFQGWLKRTGNAKMHGTTKKVPAKVFEFEREHLRPILFQDKKSCETSITRIVRKDNTVLYNSNRYTLPLGTYNKESEVRLRIEGDVLQIWDPFEDYMITEHPISLLKGQLIKRSDHRRNKEDSLQQLQKKVLEATHEAWLPYLLEIRERKPRYYRDQLQLLLDLAGKYDKTIIEDAICYCMEKQLYSTVDVKNACLYLASQQPMEDVLALPGKLHPMNSQMLQIHTQKRDIGEYAHLEGGRHE